MLRVECESENDKEKGPDAFYLADRRYRVIEVIDRWYGERSVCFKVRADDENIYLLKHDERHGQWDLVFYQNPRKLETLPSLRSGLLTRTGKTPELVGGKRYSSLH
ncbi:MAG: hypothetical protein G3M78_05790 [Candidatus Nitrohelix vancouverensis]|uniref:Uncharacterized protein n=1 Tax=Candidatus Nitrohelix vancouverensis TaxID=2705534 RepID=A0A7T0C1P0_9BACT|nr:MAG: hypothetical protein G3M78_05790 [Candidatus Nitrohelix vancouverensis]